jgi:hypothetical protein
MNKTELRFIRFVLGNVEGNWRILNRKIGSELGRVEWFPEWKKYVVEFTPGCVFDEKCLVDIATFLASVNRKRGV